MAFEGGSSVFVVDGGIQDERILFLTDRRTVEFSGF